MKKEIKKSHYRVVLLLIALFLTNQSVLTAQFTEEKSIEKQYSLDANSTLELDHSRGTVNIKKSTSSQILAKLNYKVRGKSEKNVKALLEKLSIEDKKTSSNKLQLKTKLNIKNWMQVFGSSKIKFQDGTVIKGITSIEANLDIWVPEGLNIEVKNKYHDIDIEAMNANLQVVLYEGNLYAGDLKGDLNLNLKYGKGELGNVQNADIVLYESSLKMKNAENFKMNSKYSKHTIGNIENPKIQAYEGTFTIGAANGLFELNDKYSSFEINSVEKGDFQLYETKIKAEQLGSMTFNSKYAKLRIGTAQLLDFKLSYEDELEIKNLSHLKSANSKYAEMEIESLAGGIELLQDYESDINVRSVSNQFKKLHIAGKYTKIYMPIPAAIKYQLEVDVKYGSVNYPEANFESIYYKEKGDKLEIKGKMNGATENSPSIYLNGYELGAKLK